MVLCGGWRRYPAHLRTAGNDSTPIAFRIVCNAIRIGEINVIDFQRTRHGGPPSCEPAAGQPFACDTNGLRVERNSTRSGVPCREKVSRKLASR